MDVRNLNYDLYELQIYVERMQLAYRKLSKINDIEDLDEFITEKFDIDVLQLKYHADLIEKDLKALFGSVINPAAVGRYSSKTRLKTDEPAAAHNN